jgi:NMD protein affecting ribosome stability and mRNA decay
MHLDPHVAIAAVSTLGAAWLMMKAGLQKSALEYRKRRRVCPSCGREIRARVCATCST